MTSSSAQAATNNSEPVKITIAGVLGTAEFHKCVSALQYLGEQNPGVVTGEVLQFFST